MPERGGRGVHNAFESVIRPVRGLLDRVFHRGRLPVTPDLTTPASVIPVQEPVTAVSTTDQQAQVELTPRQIELRQEAERLANQLSRIEGRKALVIIVDDAERKLLDAEAAFMKAATERNTGYTVSLKNTGEDAVDFYQAFKQIDSKNETPTLVIIILDGDLATRDNPTSYKRGFHVAERISEISGNNKWEMPKLVSNSTEGYNNALLKTKFPESYLTDWDTETKAMLDSIDSHLK